MSQQDDDAVSRAVAELGEPEFLFEVGRGRLAAKLALGVLLVAYGVAANYYWWVLGPRRFGHLEILLLFALPAVGVSLLLHMYRSRGLRVLVYPSGLLRLQRGEVASFPWAEVTAIRLRVQRADAVEPRRGPDGPVPVAFDVDVPAFQLWNAHLTVDRSDGESATFGPALTGYDRLAKEVQLRTFPAAWARAWAEFRGGRVVEFGPLVVTQFGLRHENQFLAWREVKELALAQGKLSVKRAGKWLPWVVKDVSDIPNPHVLVALVAEARRLAAAPNGVR